MPSCTCRWAHRKPRAAQNTGGQAAARPQHAHVPWQPAPPLGCNGVSSPWSWLTLLPTQLPSARGWAHAWHAMTFSTAGCGPATPELASHHLSESAWMCPHLPFLERCGPFLRCPPSSLRSGCGSQRPHSVVQSESLTINCLLCVGGGAGCLPTGGIPTATFKRGG